MKVLLLARIKSQNGTRTVISRLAAWLSRNGHEVYFLRFDSDPEYLQELARYCRIVGVRDAIKERSLACFAFTIDGVILAALLKRVWRTNWLILPVVLHPRQFIDRNPAGRPAMAERAIAKLIRSGGNIIFMNEVCHESHEQGLGLKIKETIIPLPLVNQPAPRQRPPAPRLIVSVGRLVSFKNYHPFVLDFIMARKAMGEVWKYKIYGDGPLRGDVQRLINERGLCEEVSLEGAIPHSKFNAAAEEAYIFIGMGAAVIEAANLAVPTIIASDTSLAVNGGSYGFMTAAIGASIGEYHADLVVTTVGLCLEEAAEWTDGQYRAMCAAAVAGARKFSVDYIGPLYVRAANDLKSTDIDTGPIAMMGYIFDRLWRRLSQQSGEHK